MIELLIVIGVTLIMVAGVRPLIGGNISNQVNESASQIISNLRIARERAVARVNNSAHGVFFTINASGADSLTVYQGSSYALRDPTYDLVINFDAGVNIITTLSGTEVNFSRQFGTPSNTGTVTVSHQAGGLVKIVTVGSLGKIEVN